MLKRSNKLVVLGLALSLVLFVLSTSFAFQQAKFAVITDTHMELWLGKHGDRGEDRKGIKPDI